MTSFSWSTPDAPCSLLWRRQCRTVLLVGNSGELALLLISMGWTWLFLRASRNLLMKSGERPLALPEPEAVNAKDIHLASDVLSVIRRLDLQLGAANRNDISGTDHSSLDERRAVQ